MANTTMGSAPTQRHWRVEVHGSEARRRHNLIPASNHAPSRVDKGKIGAGLGWLPREKAQGRLNDAKDTARALVDGGGAPVTRGEGW